MRLSFTVIIALLICFFNTQAQQFEWASSGDNANGGVRASVLDEQGNLIVAGVLETGYSYNAERSMYSSAGDSIRVSYRDFMFVASYSPEGKINWFREIPGADDPVGMGLDKKGNIVVMAMNRRNPYFDELGVRVNEGNYFIVHFSANGKALKVVSDSLKQINHPMRFAVSNQGGYLISQSEYSYEQASAGHTESVNWITLLKLNESMELSWKGNVRRWGNHGYYNPGMLFDESSNGDVYTIMSVAEGISVDGKNYKAPVVDSVGPYAPAYEAYLICYNKSGKVKWVKTSGGKSIFSSIKVTQDALLLGGKIVNNEKFFGKQIDTTEKKQMVLASFSLNGKMKWAETTRATTIRAITVDQQDNIYAIVESKISYPDSLIFYQDTLKNVYDNMLIASFDAKGNFRWIKHTKLPMSMNECPSLITDHCGNIFVSGELWWVMKAEMKWFDAALVKGYGYGPVPFIGKIKNTLPKQVLPSGQTECMISPAPWTIRNYPNPFRESTTVQYKTTYKDERVSLSLYGINGNLVKMLFSGKAHEKGTHTFQLQANDLAKGVYVLVLRGTEAVATERIVVL